MAMIEAQTSGSEGVSFDAQKVNNRSAISVVCLLTGERSLNRFRVAIKKAPWDDGKYANASKSLDHGSLRIKAPFMFRRLGTYFRNGENAPSSRYLI